MSDRELLELAAKAASISRCMWDYEEARRLGHMVTPSMMWNPLLNDGQAFRLAATLNLDIRFSWYDDVMAVFAGGSWDDAPELVHELFERDVTAATRRVITRAAAEIGKNIGAA